MEVEKLISDFKEIMDKYPQAMTEEQKGHPFASKMRNDFRDDLISLIESITDSSYNYRISPGFMGNWANPPWAGIISTSLPNKFTDGLYVIYHFNFENDLIDFSINQGLDNIKRTDAISRAKKLRKHADLIGGFTLDDDPDFRNSQTAILYKKYDINSIDSEEFMEDLKNLLEVYEKLIPIYTDIISTNDSQNDEIGDENNDETNYWLFAPGPSASMWDLFYDKKVMGMGGDYLGDLNKYSTREDIVKALQKHYHNKSRYPNDSLAYWQMLHEIKPGDIIFAKKGVHEIVGYGVVESGYFFDESLGEYAHAVAVNWKEKGNWSYKGNLITKTLTKITDYPDLIGTITNYFETYLVNVEKVQKENKSTDGDTMTGSDYGLLNVNNRNIWRIIPGRTEIMEEIWKECKEKGFISIGFSSGKSVDYSKYKSVEDIRDLLLDINVDISENTTAPQMVWNFVNEIKVNDIIVANNGRYGKIYGIGIVKSDYIPPEKIDFEIKGSMKHIRRVDWIISDEFSTDITFDIKALAPVKNENWNLIVKAYNDLNENLKLESIKSIYNEFKNTYYYSIQSEELRSKYFECSEKFKKDFNDIKVSINDGNDETDKIFYNLIYPTNTLFAGYASDIKQLIKKTYNRTEEDLNRLAIKYLNLIDKSTKSDSELRVDLIKFDNDELTKSIKTAYISASLYYLDNNRFYAINQKTINTVKFLSNYINIGIDFDNKLEHYIESNEKYHRYIKEIGEYIPELGTFEMFDHFCHWICDKKLGYYATSGKLPLSIMNFTVETPTEIIDTKTFNINPLDIQTSLKINEKILYQTAAILNSSKNIIFEGVPGTGKTRLAMDICEYAKDENFCDDYLITTATSDWTTFDVIGGLMPDTNGNLNFEEGIFLKAIRENKLLIIDEINRADIDKAFGQLFTVLSGSPVELNFKIDDRNISIDHTDELESFYDNSTKTYYIGRNFRILATMNNYDKDSLYELSYAFMRRFAFVEVDIPSEDDFKALIDIWNDELVLSLPEELIYELKILLDIRNIRKLGPAIFYDMINYMENRLSFDSTVNVLEETIISFIFPQFEGLSRKKLGEIRNLLVENNLVRESVVEEKFNELSGLNF